MPRDYKDVWNEAYNSAIENGKTEQEAIVIANDELADYEAKIADAANEKYGR